MTTTDRLTDAPLLVTLPRVLKSEVETLAALCRAGAGPIHIRKPDSSAAEVERLLRDLCAAGADMDCFTLHYDEPLARRYGLGGVHLRGERIAAGAGEGLRRSCSTHGWDEAERYGPVADYVFLSPLFDSISKAGYRSAVSLEEARSRLPLSEGRVVALGGVCAENIAWARLAGFDGAASLGAVWVTEGDRLDAQATVLRFLKLRRKWRAAGGCLQLISDGNLSVAEAFLRGGGRWVQLRMKDVPAGQIVGRGRELLALCRAWGALLIVNDAPELSAEIGADGVHLGQGDMAPAEARRIVGEGAIVGSTANTFEQIAARCDGQTDYIGLGPFRYTTTKKNLAPVLGTEGYRSILERMRQGGIALPVVAIGGILPEDVPGLMPSGVMGVAVSGALSRAADAERQTVRFVKSLRAGVRGRKIGPQRKSGQ